MTETLINSETPQMEAGRRALLQGWTGGGRDLLITRASGSLVWDSEGREYIDCTSQAWSNNVGACHPRVLAAASEQMAVLTHARTNFETAPLLELSARMVEIAPAGLDRVGFCPNGSLAGEMAIKLALHNSDHPGPIITFMDGYHGRSLATMAASWPHPGGKFVRMFPPFVRTPNPRTYRTAGGISVEEEVERCLLMLRETIRSGTQGKPPALMMEPVLGNGGQQEYPLEFYRRVREICDEEDVLLIVDEVQTGACRGGTMWACDHYGLRPDIVVWGKGFGGGFPLAGVLLSEGLRGFAPGDDSVTFGQFPIALAAGLATVDVLIDERLDESSRLLGAHATERVRDLAQRHPLIGDIRCPGLNIGIELVRDRVTKEPAVAETNRVYRRAQELGVMLGTTRYAGAGNVLKIKPPLNIPRDQLDAAIDVFDRALGDVESGTDLE